MTELVEFNNYFRLSIQRALLGNITHNIRAIVAELKHNDIQLFFYYDGKIQEDDEETASEIGTEVIADFSDDYNLDVNISRIDYPQPINHANGLYVYFRKES